MLTLKQLRHMQAVIEQGSIHRAAEHLHITQPALTRSLASLEERLGLRLFDRSKSGMQATAFCRRIQARCEHLLLEMAELEREADLYRNLSSGRLSIGFGRAMKEMVISSVLPAFVGKYPRVQLNLADGTPEELISGLMSRRFDMLVTGGVSYAATEGITIELLRSYRMSVFTREKHPLVGRMQVPLSELVTFPLISPTLLSTRHPFLKKLTASSSELHVHILGSDYQTLEQILQVSDYWMVAPECRYTDEYTGPGLATSDVADWDLTGELSVIELAGRSRSPAAERFIEFCQDVLP